MSEFFLRAYPPAQITSGPVYWLPLRERKEFLVAKTSAGLDLIQGDYETLAATFNPTSPPLYLANVRGIPLVASHVGADTVVDADWHAGVMYHLFGAMEEKLFAIVGYAYQMLEWERASRFCPACASATVYVLNDWGKRCSNPECGLVRYPPVSPAVLILIHDGGDQIFLGQKAGWGKRYSILAGFVEPGETFEDCVRREALEESGLQITGQPIYQGSQPWPFPHQVMVGYTVEHSNADDPINFDSQELEDARWFRFDQMPEIPPGMSLSGQLIRRWVASRQQAHAQA